jgi:ABC-type antimicrobial peptide transport system permease subunit
VREYVEAGLGPRRFNLGLFAAFALSGVLLALFGMYALVAYTVGQRQREIGLRMAIGATQRDILRMVLRQAAWRGVVGIAVGAGVAAALRRLVSADLAVPVSALVGAAALLLLLVLLAAWAPARRAARLSPTLALY